MDRDSIPYKQWDRLAICGRRVRTLQHNEAPEDDDEGEPNLVAASTYQYILQNLINRFSILPNLRSLSWRVGPNIQSVSQVAMLVSSSVQKLKLSFCNARIEDAEATFGHLQGRIPNVKDLVIEGDGTTESEIEESETFSEPLAELLGSLKCLNHITMNHWLFSEAVLISVGSLPRLHKVDSSEWWITPGPLRPWYNRFHLDKPSFFVALEHLSVSMELEEASSLFQGIRGTLNLKHFGITIIRHVKSGSLREFLEVLVAACSTLTEVVLILKRSTDDPITAQQTHLDDLTPLYHANLTQFEIYDEEPVGGSYLGVLEMAKAWPGLKELTLTPTEAVPDPMNPPVGLDVTVLAVLASHCSDLRTLNMYVSVGKDFRYSNPEAQFCNMKKLDLGPSILYPEASAEVAAFLAALIPPISSTQLIAKVYRPGNNPWGGPRDEMTTLVGAIQTSREDVRSGLGRDS